MTCRLEGKWRCSSRQVIRDSVKRVLYATFENLERIRYRLGLKRGIFICYLLPSQKIQGWAASRNLAYQVSFFAPVTVVVTPRLASLFLLFCILDYIRMCLITDNNDILLLSIIHLSRLPVICVWCCVSALFKLVFFFVISFGYSL